MSKTGDHIEIKIKMPNPSQEPPAPSKAPNEDLKDINVICTFKIKIQSQTPVRNPQRPPKPQMKTLRTRVFFAPSKSK